MKPVILNSMTQSHGKTEKKTLKQLLEMPKDELKAYLLSIPMEERKPINNELFKAIYDQTFQKIVEHIDR